MLLVAFTISVVFDLLCRKDRERDPRDRERDSYRSVTTFAEKKDYRPDVKVEYVDDFGRMLDPKEVHFNTVRTRMHVHTPHIHVTIHTFYCTLILLGLPFQSPVQRYLTLRCPPLIFQQWPYTNVDPCVCDYVKKPIIFELCRGVS